MTYYLSLRDTVFLNIPVAPCVFIVLKSKFSFPNNVTNRCLQNPKATSKVQFVAFSHTYGKLKISVQPPVFLSFAHAIKVNS